MRRTLVGLTGGIGSGKSTVAAMLKNQGAAVVDADRLAHNVTLAGGSAIPALVQTFGAKCLLPDGSMDRAHMRAKVFDEPQARQQLQAITHPLIGQAVATAVAAATEPVVVLDIPLLVESGRWRAQCDWVVVVDCTEATQLRRVHARSGWSHVQTQAVIQAQVSRRARLAAADAVLDNDQTTLTDLTASVTRLGHWLGL